MPPSTLFLYLLRRLGVAVVVLAAGLASLVMFVELNENLRYVAKVRQGGFGFAALAALMRAPSTLMLLAPFVFLCGAIWAFHQLNRRAELAVMRASGLSVWRIIGPAALLAAVAGLALILIVDPIASHLLAASERMKLDLRGRSASMVQIFGDGIWLRQRDGDDVLIINARQFNPADAKIGDVTLLRIDKTERFVERVDAAHGLLSGRTIELYEARIRAAGQSVDMRTPVYAVTSTLTPKDLKQSVSKPESLSLWRLPRFILLAEASGMPTLRYSMRFHDLCSTPLKLIAMVLIAAMFSLRPHRSGGAFRLMLSAIGAGFFLYVLTQISAALGLSGAVPAAIAAWSPAAIAALVALWVLIRVEEG